MSESKDKPQIDEKKNKEKNKAKKNKKIKHDNMILLTFGF
jgi:hypothetical protein